MCDERIIDLLYVAVVPSYAGTPVPGYCTVPGIHITVPVLYCTVGSRERWLPYPVR